MTKKKDNEKAPANKAKSGSGNPSVNLMKKAIDQSNSNSYVKKSKDGKKVITLGKSGENSTERKDNQSKIAKHEVSEGNQQSTSNVFDRLNKKGTKSNLDVSLDSVIQKQKHNNFPHPPQEWQPGKRKRPQYDSSREYKGGHQVEELDMLADQNQEGEAGTISLGKRNNNIRQNKRQKYEEEGEGEDNTGYKKPYGGYKGYKQPMMGGYNPQMFDYSQMYMDPYMMYQQPYMPPFKPKKFKNKSLIINKDAVKHKGSTPKNTPAAQVDVTQKEETEA
jgi:hypothetical protein